ncbi:hypothetical protein P4634_26940, partial [Neobacillus mesonae]|nr:hypothetical protein [Neobacillus mesonae]
MDINSTLIDPATSTMVTEASKFLFNKIANKIKNICDDNNLQVVSYCELAEQFSEYLWQNYEKYKSIPTIALRDDKVLLESIYQPL